MLTLIALVWYSAASRRCRVTSPFSSPTMVQPKAATERMAVRESRIAASAEDRLEVVPRVGPEGDERLGVRDAGHVADGFGHEVGERLVGLHAQTGDEIVPAGHRVNLGGGGQVAERCRHRGDPAPPAL